MESILRWIFNRENAVEKILITLILVGCVLLFKEQITTLVANKLAESNTLIDQLLTY